jgi:hypothetical protein
MLVVVSWKNNSMKIRQFLLVTILLVHASGVWAKAGGHGGHCGHGGHGAYVAGHSSSDEDKFADMRGKLCTGYLVYKGDTLSGMITCTDNQFFYKKDALQDSTTSFKIRDTALSYACLHENGKVLQMIRLDDKHLYRVYHTGKLSLYDTYFSFDYLSKKFYNLDDRVAYNGENRTLNDFWAISAKRKLVQNINEAYGTSLRPNTYNKKALLAYMQTLD